MNIEGAAEKFDFRLPHSVGADLPHYGLKRGAFARERIALELLGHGHEIGCAKVHVIAYGHNYLHRVGE